MGLLNIAQQWVLTFIQVASLCLLIGAFSPFTFKVNGYEGPLQEELQTTAQENKREHKQMGKHSMLMDRKNQYHENGFTAPNNL